MSKIIGINKETLLELKNIKQIMNEKYLDLVILNLIENYEYNK